MTQTVAQLSKAHTDWALFNVKKIRKMVESDLEEVHAEVVALKRESLKQLACILCEVTLVLRNASVSAENQGTEDC